MARRPPPGIPQRGFGRAAPGAAAMAGKLRQAVAWHREGKLDRAEAAYREILATAPGHPVAPVARALSLRALHRNEEAVAAYDRVLRLKPDFAEILCNRGNALADLRHHDEALASYARALQLKPGYA